MQGAWILTWWQQSTTESKVQQEEMHILERSLGKRGPWEERKIGKIIRKLLPDYGLNQVSGSGISEK